MRRLLIVSVGLGALMVGAVLAWSAVRQERDYQDLIAAGDAALSQDQTYGAIEAFSGALALKRDSMLAYLKRGDTYRQRGEFAAALRDLQDATLLDPAAPRPVELLGDVNSALGQYTEASTHYETFIALDDRSPRVLYKLALAYYRSGERERAIGRLRDAVELDADFTEALYLFGMCLRENGQDEEALDTLARAVEISPAFVAAREEMITIFDRGGRRQEALEQREALAALEPTRAARLIDLGLTYARGGRTDAAVLTLGRAAERFPDQPAVYTALGRVWLEAPDFPDSRVALSKAIEALQLHATSAGASGETLMLYGRAMLRSGDARVAERVLLQAAEQVPVQRAVFLDLADAAEQLGHVPLALEALHRYVALGDDSASDSTVARRLARLQQLPPTP
jgi:tetratricopeptide (TPR) repeat protein